jgi:hypothetical protein
MQKHVSSRGDPYEKYWIKFRLTDEEQRRVFEATRREPILFSTPLTPEEYASCEREALRLLKQASADVDRPIGLAVLANHSDREAFLLASMMTEGLPRWRGEGLVEEETLPGRHIHLRRFKVGGTEIRIQVPLEDERVFRPKPPK